MKCIRIIYTHRGFAALQLLEFHWNSTYIGTWLPEWWTYQRIFTISYLDTWKLSLGCSPRVYRVHYVCHCISISWLWLKLLVVYHEQLVLKSPWVIQNVYIAKHPLSTCIQTVYTRFAPPLSKYGVYTSSPLIVLLTGVQYCATHVH